LGVVDDPRGVVETQRTETSGTTTGDITEVKTFHNKIKFNALFAKNFYDFTVRGGIMENAGGVGFDYHMFSRRLRFSLEAFDFDDMVLRAFLRFNIFKGVYVMGGGDNLTNDTYRSGFIGAGIFITNDDLKLLASKMSFN
jgi:phospholipid/cholesterol/gamma-HCH transport system substrate-binding protein